VLLAGLLLVLLNVCALLNVGAQAQISTDVIGQHALGPGGSGPVKGTSPGSCQYCHAPHSGLDNALWNQKLTTQTYTPYTSSTYSEKGNSQVPQQTDTNLCLSCHDGTVAAGLTIVYGKIATGNLASQDVIATLQSSHPVSLVLPLVDAPDLVASLASNGTTGDPTYVKLINGNIECTSCHNPHVEAKDPIAKNFLVKDSSSGALCLDCHDPNRVLNGVPSGLAGWPQSIHATSNMAVQNLPYGTLALNACLNCHTDHNASGAEWLQRGAGDQVCLNCHSGTSQPTSDTNRLTSIAPRVVTGGTASMARINVAEEYAKTGHPVSNGAQLSQATVNNKLQTPDQTRVTANPNTPNLSGCVNCHDPHSVQSITSFSPAPQARASERGVSGLSETDSVTLVKPAESQYQICFRCHGPSQGKSASKKFGYEPQRLTTDGDVLNLIPQFNQFARSAHPVVRNRTSPLPQPSLRPKMLNLDGSTKGRDMGVRVLCTDCHNSDDNREFGGTGPSGPHGSKWTHILERRYEFSQTIIPGQLITNLFPNPDLSSNGPYALCGKCHDLANIMQNVSFKAHSLHLNAGFSCSVCHTPHGMQSNSMNSTGERLVNFDQNVVAPRPGSSITYTRASGTCTLTCHQAVHNPDGSVITLGVKAIRR
jgi:predicted CXXCH cytochrome family protein